jgi:hypothetical protein
VISDKADSRDDEEELDWREVIIRYLQNPDGTKDQKIRQ